MFLKEIDVVDDGVCSPCREWKASKLPFRGSFENADEVGDIIYSDMAGKLPISFADRYQYKTNLRMIILGKKCCFYAAQEPVTPSFYGFPS
jgi:hypothetical protein